MLTAFAGGRLLGDRHGSGRSQVLALHGWGGSHAQMTGVVEGMDAISLDLPGFGATAAPDEAWGAEEYAKCVAPVLDEMTAPVVIVGYSFGGRVAVHLGAAYPDKVKAIVLTGAPLLRDKPSGKAPLVFRAMKQANKFGIVSDARMEQERKKRGSADYRNADGVMRNVLVRVVNETYEEQLKALRCPVEMVWGENDTAAPLVAAERAKEMISTPVDMHIVPGGTHWFLLENPEPVRAAVTKWAQ